MRLRLGIRFKEAVAVSLVALTLVAVTTAVHLAQLTRVIVEEAGRQVDITNIKAQQLELKAQLDSQKAMIDQLTEDRKRLLINSSPAL